MAILKWIGTHESVPELYEAKIVCYRCVESGRWLVGSGHRHEQGWTIYGECEEYQEAFDNDPWCVCAWMEWPSGPRLAVMRRTNHLLENDAREGGE
jgi:hypothetical protein